MAVSLAELVEDELRGQPVGVEDQPVPVATGVEGIVDVECDRPLRIGAILDERRRIGAAVVIRVELIGTEEGEAVAVADDEAV